MKPAIFFVEKTKQIYAKTSTVTGNAFQIKAMSGWKLFGILVMSAVICKQRLLNKNETVQYFQNYKRQDVD